MSHAGRKRAGHTKLKTRTMGSDSKGDGTRNIFKGGEETQGSLAKAKAPGGRGGLRGKLGTTEPKDSVNNSRKKKKGKGKRCRCPFS